MLVRQSLADDFYLICNKTLAFKYTRYGFQKENKILNPLWEPDFNFQVQLRFNRNGDFGDRGSTSKGKKRVQIVLPS